MPHEAGDLFQEWRVADRNAHVLEQLLFKASMASLSGEGPVPTQTDQDRAHKLREIANDLFRLAMDEMKRRATAARR